YMATPSRGDCDGETLRAAVVELVASRDGRCVTLVTLPDAAPGRLHASAEAAAMSSAGSVSPSSVESNRRCPGVRQLVVCALLPPEGVPGAPARCWSARDGALAARVAAVV